MLASEGCCELRGAQRDPVVGGRDGNALQMWKPCVGPNSEWAASLYIHASIHIYKLGTVRDLSYHKIELLCPEILYPHPFCDDVR